MSAWTEMTGEGRPGRQTVALMMKLTLQIVKSSGFPPPVQHRHWDVAAAEDFLGAMIIGKNGHDFIRACSLEAVDDKSFERLLLKTIRNWLIDEAKTTVVGRMRRRLSAMLKSDGRFLDATRLLAGSDGWTLQEHEENVWTGDHQTLFQSSYRGSDDGLTTLNRAGKTSAGNVAVLTGYLHHVLVLALGAIRTQLLARFVVARYSLDETVELDAAADADAVEPLEQDEVDANLLVTEVSEAILAEMATKEDVTVLALWDDMNHLTRSLRVPISAAEEMRDDLLDRIKPFCARNAEGVEGFNRAVDAAREHLALIESSDNSVIQRSDPDATSTS